VHLASGSLCEMLRQAVDQGGFHDSRSFAFNTIQRLQLAYLVSYRDFSFCCQVISVSYIPNPKQYHSVLAACLLPS